MILVDTSVWIDHLRGSDPELASLLHNGDVLAHPWVTGELALGRLAQRSEILGLRTSPPTAAPGGAGQSAAEQLALVLGGQLDHVWAVSFIVTNIPTGGHQRFDSAVEVEAWFRHRTDIEDRFKDAKLGAALRHLPSGHAAIKAVLPNAHPADLYLTGAGGLLTIIYMAGLLFRPKKEHARLGVDTIAVLAIYIVVVIGLITLPN